MCTVLPILLDRIDERLHADRVSAVILLQVVDIKFDCVTLAYIANGKEVPLAVVERVVIEIQE